MIELRKDLNHPDRFTLSPTIALVISMMGVSFLLLGCANASKDELNQSSSILHNSELSNLAVEHQIKENSSSTEGQMLPITAEATIHGHVIALEVAQTPLQQSIGLMFREDLPDNRGMLFPFTPPRPVNFWMRNVQFPLDMIFLRNGEVQAIASDVPPCITPSCPTYGPDGDIDQVIELKGGRAEDLGITIGDIITIEFFEN